MMGTVMGTQILQTSCPKYLIRDYASLLKTTKSKDGQQQQHPRVSTQTLEAMAIQKGFTKEQLMMRIEEC